MKKSIKIIKHSLKQLKSTQKNLYFSNVMNKYKTTIKETWQLIKEALGKGQVSRQVLPIKIVVNKKNITSIESTAIIFNKSFTGVGPNLVQKLQIHICFTVLLKNVSTKMYKNKHLNENNLFYIK